MDQIRIEQLLKSQDAVRRHYRAGRIAAAIEEYDTVISPAVDAVDPRISGCARRLARSFIQMVDDDLNQQEGKEA